jgi:type IV secretion system protein VirB9
MLAGPAVAQVSPTLPGGDTRLQTVVYDADRVVRLRVPLGYQTTVAFDAEERIETIAVGDSSVWQVTPNARGDHLFVKPLEMGQITNLTVLTDTRLYSFELVAVSAPSADAPFAVRFVYPEPAAAPEQTAAPANGVYRLGGAQRLRPVSVTDDGVHTYIEWAPGRDLPAVFALDDQNREVLVTGYVRGDQFVIDAVYPVLVFRSDRQTARATREAPRVRQ